jgi:hypothetical protein
MDVKRGSFTGIATLEQAAKSIALKICPINISISQTMQSRRIQMIMESMRMEIKCLSMIFNAT